ncbi:PSD1 and planctomycete cytochrome C domain-containing protein [Neorhodopirellula pilleata]|nr:PSD1 and planctomycete cytochrome C domain-containing protein [Neorhodopirellula pilleata]
MTTSVVPLGAFATANEISSDYRIDFNEHIRPIFNAHCTACHGGVKQAGDVSFAYKDRVLPPEGWIVEPGDPDASVLIERVISDDPDTMMPPPDHGKRLSQDEVSKLRRWIEQGAPWSNHWAYEKAKPQPIPNVVQSDWCRDPLDHFVLAKLQDRSIAPSPEATPSRWLRRVSLDLTGLPPQPDDLDAFLSAVETEGDAAYEQEVDRLLGHSGFGERWASVWLDQIRYADSKGLGLDGRRNAWKYRDWVIDAFNRDLPYDEFTIAQIAGDLRPDATMEDLIATAAHRMTQTNEEGGTDDEEFRIAAVLDRVNTTWQAWQGVTFGCVQCHSHPYDPFEHDEYYQFAAFFNNTSDSDLGEEWPTLQVPIDPKDYDKATVLDRSIKELERSIWQRESVALNNNELWQPLLGIEASTNNQTRVDVKRNDDRDEFFTVGTVSGNTDITVEAPLAENFQRLTAIRLTAMPLEPESAVTDSEWGFVLAHWQVEMMVPGSEKPQELEFTRVIADEPHPFDDPARSLDAKSNRGFSAYTRIHYPRQAAFVLKEPVAVQPGSTIRVRLKHRINALGAFPLIIRRGHLSVSGDDRWAEMEADAKLRTDRAELARLKSERGKIRSTSLPVLAEREPHLARPTNVFIRGLFLTKDKEVSPGTPASLPPLDASGKADRLALAQWLVDESNPLTARVAVNRVWAQLFGVGIVATEEDFGSSGEPPTHPELLDYLSLRFENEHDWKFKSLIRELVLSSTYRQSSAYREDLADLDPNNRWLARGPKHRLDAETVRDQALALSGLLSPAMHGPPVHPPIPDGVWKPFEGGDKWSTPSTEDGDRYRRSIYTYTKRSIPFPMFAAFDAPSRELCTPRRLRSNTPLQALMMLNDATLVECATAFADRMQASAPETRDQLANGFRMATCRAASDAELDELVSLHTQIGSLSGVASVLLNLDEVLTK